MVGAGRTKPITTENPTNLLEQERTDDGGVTRLLQKETVAIGPFVVTVLITLAFFFWRNDL